MRRNEIELLAPVGSYASLVAAKQGHADAVYFGADTLNMRSGSSDMFVSNDIYTLTARAHEYGLKAYLTLNTIIYDNDIPIMERLLDEAARAGVDAIIASDIAVILDARARNLSVHISTQQNISNSRAVEYFAQWADTVVLARELSLAQVHTIADAIRDRCITGPSGKLVRIEIFAHGALCMAISGKCYLSLHTYSASANRGQCMQVCRRRYRVHDIEDGFELEIDNEHIMSPKDLCTIDFLDRIISAGVSVLKIEGRARPPEYVRTVTEAYHEALCALADGYYSPALMQSLKSKLADVFNRGFWDGYYLGRKLGEWADVHGSKANYRRKRVGIVKNFYKKIGVAEIETTDTGLDKGVRVLLVGPTTGSVFVDAAEPWSEDGHPLVQAGKGLTISLKVPEPVRRNDVVYVLEPRT
ncbi:MAG TPA: peptidase U32 family protein [Spirochaetia bacterium]|nr:peptidase U32 family protein [Spirochaetales bacterium]HRS64467.1 peptidase U32 family protein [Spirochaetia bacterium]HRV27936.1 peptidase U32 family protein [Spirochaetia bacterium]